MKQQLRRVAIAAEPYVCQSCTRQLRWEALGKQQKRWQSATSSTGARPRPGVLRVLEERGYVKEIAGDRDRLSALLDARQTGIYSGIDPTAPSLHLGHLLPFMVLLWFYSHGHHAVSLVGGATARVGDPSGRLVSRDGKAAEKQHEDFDSMFAQVGTLWENAKKVSKKHGHSSEQGSRQTLLNNGEWLEDLNILDFLRIIGVGARMGTMMGRDTVKNKMERGDGMSFAEFTYPLLQAWDWWHMYRKYDVQIQVGGSDQYGNIVAGMDAVKHNVQNHTTPEEQQRWLSRSGDAKEDMQPMGLTVPLLTTSSGEKFGKSAGNAIWLDRHLTSPFDLYGFLLRSADDDVERYLKLFTLLPTTDIDTIMEQHRNDPGMRQAQHLLAGEVLELVHGSEEASRTTKQHQELRAPSLRFLSRQNGTSKQDGSEAVAESQIDRLVLSKNLVLDQPFSRILANAKLASSNSEGLRKVKSGGVYVATRPERSEGEGDGTLQFVQVKDQAQQDVAEFIVDGLLVLRMGKWRVTVIEVTD